MQLDMNATNVDRILAEAFGAEAFVIGGPVRDKLRSLFHGVAYDPKDKDYVITRHTLDQVRERLAGIGRIDTVGASFGVLKLTVPGEPTVDVALPRRERSTGWGHKQFDVQSGPDISIEEDQARRDFLMNAVAVRLTDGEVLAHPGAVEDIRAKRISVINGRQSFIDDPLRMLRAAQFAARFGFEIEPTTFTLMCECAPMIREEPPVPAERLAEELNKLLMKSERPSIGLRVLRDTGLLPLVIPGLEAAIGVAQNRFHAHDVFEHSLAVLDASRPTLVARWAALLHDIGKPRTQSKAPGRNGYTFYDHENVGAAMARAILLGLRYPNELVERITRLIANHMYLADPALEDATIKRFINRVGQDLLDDQFHLRKCDNIGSGLPEKVSAPHNATFERRVYDVLAQRPPMDIKDLAIDGHDVIAAFVAANLRLKGFAGGREVGEVLRSLHEKVIDDPSLNTPERLRAEMATLITTSTATGTEALQKARGGRQKQA
jgi:putative nucleotidyltransferase with HDIG domain